MSSLQHVPLPPSGKKTTNVRFEKKVENNKKEFDILYFTTFAN